MLSRCFFHIFMLIFFLNVTMPCSIHEPSWDHHVRGGAMELRIVFPNHMIVTQASI